MYTGPHLIKDNLVFGYDTGYGVADNNTATRFYPGENTTNAVPLSTFIDTSNWTGSGWSGAIAVSTDYDNTLELTSTNGWRTWRINTGITSGGTVTVSYEYRMKTLVTNNIYMLNLNGDHLGSYVNGLGNISAADTQDLGNWKTFTSSWTANSNSNLAIGLRGTDGAGLSDTIYVRNLQVELKGHATPFTATSRSSTQSLIDLKNTTDIDVSNISFDSTGQPTFDGTNDHIHINPISINAGTGISFEAIYSAESSYNTWGTYHYLLRFTGSTHYGLLHEGDSRGWRIDVPTSTGTRTGSTTNSPNATAGAGYYHVAVSYDSVTGGKGYLNGEQIGSWSGGYTAFTPTGLIIGAESTSTRFWNGDIPLVRVYNRALSVQEVQQNFNVYKNRFGI